MTTKHNLLIIYVHYELSNSILQLKEYHCSSLPTKFKMEIQIEERQKQQIPQKQHLFKTSDTPYTSMSGHTSTFSGRSCLMVVL